MHPAHRVALGVVLVCALGLIAGTGGTVQITDPGAAAQSKRFYRIIIP